MKVAIAGKGGSGKTSISGTMARLLARRGRTVLAIDGDSNPNLALTLGLSPDALSSMPTLTRDMLRRTESGSELAVSLDEICKTHSIAAPDGVTLLVMANPQHAGTGWLCSLHATVRSVIEAASEREEDVCILDTEASPEHLSRGTARYADAMYVVVEPYYKSLETGRRMSMLARDLGLHRVALIANKIRDAQELSAVGEFASQHGLDIAGVVPYDDNLPHAERVRRAPLDVAPDSPAVVAIGELAETITANGRA